MSAGNGNTMRRLKYSIIPEADTHIGPEVASGTERSSNTSAKWIITGVVFAMAASLAAVGMSVYAITEKETTNHGTFSSRYTQSDLSDGHILTVHSMTHMHACTTHPISGKYVCAPETPGDMIKFFLEHGNGGCAHSDDVRIGVTQAGGTYTELVTGLASENNRKCVPITIGQFLCVPSSYSAQEGNNEVSIVVKTFKNSIEQGSADAFKLSLSNKSSTDAAIPSTWCA
jgi:hypothetical protein